MLARSCTVLLSLLSLPSPSAAAFQDPLWSVDDPDPSGQWGAQLASLEDLDGDGVEDLAVSRSSPGSGVVRLVSAGTGATLREIARPNETEFGFRIAAAGDLDGDGLGDLLVSSGGAVHALSMASAATLWTRRSQHLEYGTDLAALDDVDQDGIPDVAIGCAEMYVYGGGDHYTTHGGGSGFVEAVSGATGGRLWIRRGPQFLSAMGGTVVNVGDVDGDGHADLLAASRHRGPLDGYPACAWVLSGTDGATLLDVSALFPILSQNTAVGLGDVDGDQRPDFALCSMDWACAIVSPAQGATIAVVSSRFGQAWSTGWKVGQALAATDDLDGDGVRDLALGAPQPRALWWTAQPEGPGVVELVSGRTGVAFRRLVGTALDGRFGAALATVGDVDGDGRRDLVVAAPDQGFAHQTGGRITAFSLSGSVHDLTKACVGSPNSSGGIAELLPSGTSSIASNDLVLGLVGTGAPVLYQLFAGPGLDFAVLEHDGNGARSWRCSASPSFAVGRAGRSDPAGGDRLHVDLGLPELASVNVGTTLAFQVLHRNAGGGVRGSDAVLVTWTP